MCGGEQLCHQINVDGVRLECAQINCVLFSVEHTHKMEWNKYILILTENDYRV